MELKYFLTVLYKYIMNYKYDMADPSLDVQDVGNNIKPAYDFIVVGAGTAGCVVANRLSEIPEWNVLLIEAGGFPSLEGQVPLVGYDPHTEIFYDTTKQPNACQSAGGYCQWPRGKGLGGSTTTNSMYYLRPSVEDSNRLEQFGNPGWGYTSVLPYYKLSERNGNYQNYYHSASGLWSIEEFAYSTPLRDAYLESAASIGIPVTDLNGQYSQGIMKTQANVNNGVRESVYRAFIKPIRGRRNLHVSINSVVEKILFFGKSATGVRFKKNGKLYSVNANYEVIMSAGAVSSPHILLLSGIGPKRHLSSIGIQLVQNLPVGQNIQDHVNIPLYFQSNVPISKEYFFNEQNAQLYVNNPSEGPLTFNGAELVARFKVNYTSLYNDILVTIYTAIAQDWNIFGLYVKNAKPQSRGTISLATKFIADPPVIDPKYFSVKDDVEITILGLHKTYQLATGEPFDKYNVTFHPDYYDKCNDYPIPSNDYFRCLIFYYSQTSCHPVGGCNMGPANSASSVIDPRLKVIGINKLRVIDSSIFPFVFDCNTQAPTVMAAEKGSDMIKQDYNKPVHIRV